MDSSGIGGQRGIPLHSPMGFPRRTCFSASFCTDNPLKPVILESFLFDSGVLRHRNWVDLKSIFECIIPIFPQNLQDFGGSRMFWDVLERQAPGSLVVTELAKEGNLNTEPTHSRLRQQRWLRSAFAVGSLLPLWIWGGRSWNTEVVVEQSNTCATFASSPAVGVGPVGTQLGQPQIWVQLLTHLIGRPSRHQENQDTFEFLNPHP